MKNTLLPNIISISLSFILLSCSFHKGAQKVDISSMESVIVSHLQDRVDTVMTLTQIPKGGPNTEKSVKTFFTDGHGNSLCFLNSNYSSYPDTAVLKELNWARLINSYDSIKLQEPEPAYYGTIIESDTTWELMEPSFPTRFILYIYLPDKLIAWETNTFEMETNPSMSKTKIINYLLKKTGRGEKTPYELFGNPRKQKNYRQQKINASRL